MKTKKARHLLSHTAANPPPTLPFSECYRPLPARSDEKEKWKRGKIIWQDVPPINSATLGGGGGGEIWTWLWVTKPPRLREMGTGLVLSHLSDISITSARSEKFCLLLCYYKWEDTSFKALLRARKYNNNKNPTTSQIYP